MEPNNLLDIDAILSEYQKDIEVDFKMDELTIKEKAMLAPVIKHKWVGRTTTRKLQLVRLNSMKKEEIKKLSGESPVPVSKAILDKIASDSEKIQKINEAIEKLEQLIVYLEKIEKVASSLTYDYKNVIDLQKLETT